MIKHSSDGRRGFSIKAIIAAAALIVASPTSAQWCKNLPVNDVFNLCQVLDPPPPPPPPKLWVKPGGTQLELAQVRYRCQRENRRPFVNLLDALMIEGMINSCMEAHGWTLK